MMRTTPVAQNSQTPFFLDDDFLVELNQAFDTLEVDPKKNKTTSPSTNKTVRNAKSRSKQTQLESMQETYVSIAQVHLRPTLRYLKAVQLGLASRDICEMVHYVIAPVIGKTRKVGLNDHTRALIGLQRELKMVLKARAHRITTEQRESLAAAYLPVQKTFSLEYRGHSAAVFNLLGFFKTLKRNPKVSEPDLKKLFAIGIPSLTMLRTSSIQEIASMSGIPTEKAQALRADARKFNILSIF